MNTLTLTTLTAPSAEHRVRVASRSPDPGRWGQVNVQIGWAGISRPQFTISPYFEGNRWVFRLDEVHHEFTWGIANAAGAIDLPDGNPPVFPKPQNSGWTDTQAHQEARDDLDTTAYLPNGPIPEGPRRWYYWVRSITEAHEYYHINDFYNRYWLRYMALFESDDVEASGVNVPYDCNNVNTTTGPAVIDGKTPSWGTTVNLRHNAAHAEFIGQSEIRAHSYSNPLYVPIWNAIPNP